MFLSHVKAFIKLTCAVLIKLKYAHARNTLDSCACVDGRSYGAAGDGQVHENPEWEKARQALASINKSQSPAKTAQANRTAAEVCYYHFVFLHQALKSQCEIENNANVDTERQNKFEENSNQSATILRKLLCRFNKCLKWHTSVCIWMVSGGGCW